jgi:hypothetical protein
MRLSLVKGKREKRELEAIHQLSKTMYTCIGDAYSMFTKCKRFGDVVIGISNLGKRITTALVV